MDQRLRHGIGHSSQECVLWKSYLRGACDVTRWEGESNESVYERSGMEPCENGVKCNVVECVKRNIFRWFCHMERKKEEFVKKVFVSEIKGHRRRGRIVVRCVGWMDRIKEYIDERGADRRKRWGLFCVAISLWDVSGGN